MSEDFIRYASSPDLGEDGIYTVECLIDAVQEDFGEFCWEDWAARQDAKTSPGYKPGFDKARLAPAARILAEKTELYFLQRTGAERPVRDLSALRFFPQIRELALNGNGLEDVSALSALPELRILFLAENAVRDLSPLANCPRLHQLDLSGNPVDDFSPLEKLPGLKWLSLRDEELAAFGKAGPFPSLETLDLWIIGDELPSLERLPLMPELRRLRGITTASLAGLERFPKLQNLVNLSGSFASLAPLASLEQLTHINILGSPASDLSPFSKLRQLRELWIHTEAGEVSLDPFEDLPLLHQLTVRCKGKEPKALRKLRKRLSSWDTEFFSKKARHSPSLTLVPVDERDFEAIDDLPPHGVWNPDGNLGMLSSERDWLDSKLEKLLRWYDEDEDYALPHQWPEKRWRDFHLLSKKPAKSLRRIASGIQEILSHMQQDWIIHLEADESYKVWVYPGKIVVPLEHEETVRRLLEK